MSGRHLVLRGLDSPFWSAAFVCAVIAAVLLCGWLYRYERRLVARAVGYRLLALRFVILLLACLALFEPVLAWRSDRKGTGRILVALDVSQSMNTLDVHAGKAEKLRWARSLGMIGNPEIDGRLEGWIHAFESGDEPEWVGPGEAEGENRRQQLERIRRDHLDEVFKQIDRLSRRELARRLLVDCRSPLVEQLKQEGNVQLVVFAGRFERADESTLSGFVAEAPGTVQAEISDLAAPLAAVGSQTDDVAAIVLLSDGRDNAAHNPIQRASQLGARKIPVFAILTGSESLPRDLAIASLDYPHAAFRGDHPLLKASLYTAGFEGDEFDVRLEREGAPALVKKVRPARSIATVEFDLDANELGRYEYSLAVAPQPGETRSDNNVKTFAISVVDDKVHVLLLDEEARWEFRYLDNALGRDERVELKHVLFRQPYMGVLNAPFFPQRLDAPDGGERVAGSPFTGEDLVIVGDVSPEHATASMWNMLEKFVADEGGTLVLTAGKRYFPLAYDSSVVADLLPVQNLRILSMNGPSEAGSPTDRGFHLKLARAAEEEPMLQFDADPVENHEIWSGLPGHLWGILGTAKPGATVLAEAVLPQAAPGGKTADSAAPIIAYQRYGFGQVLWIGVDSTWRWRHRVGDAYHHRFWGQLGRWAAKNKSVSGNEFVRFGPNRSDVNVGDEVTIRAQWSTEFLSESPNVKSKVDIFRVTGDEEPQLFSTLSLEPDKSRPTIHEGRAVSLPAGIYRIKLAVEGADIGSDEIAATIHVHERQTPELSNLTANKELLVKLSEASGGGFFQPDEAKNIPAFLRQTDVVETARRDVILWDHWLMLLTFFALLTVEWTVRKRNGLP